MPPCWAGSASNRSSIFGSGSARGPARRSRFRSVRAAVAILTDMATFEEAGISERADSPAPAVADA